ncbi:MAG: hypothetical protein ACT4QG_08070 [Sporichthyaceae bacterium]
MASSRSSHATRRCWPANAASLSEVREAPEGTEYFSILGIKLVVYVVLLGALGFVIRRARALSGSVLHRGGGTTRATGRGASIADSGGDTAVLVDVPAPPAPSYSPRGLRLLLATLGVGAAVVVLCVNLLNTVHLTIEALPAPAPDSLAHTDGVAPIFSKVEVTKAPGAGGWDVTLSLTDLHTKNPVRGVVVTVSGTGPGGAVYDSVDFTDLGQGAYRGRVPGPAGRWDLVAIAAARAGSDVPPTQQSFAVEFGSDAKPTQGTP